MKKRILGLLATFCGFFMSISATSINTQNNTSNRNLVFKRVTTTTAIDEGAYLIGGRRRKNIMTGNDSSSGNLRASVIVTISNDTITLDSSSITDVIWRIKKVSGTNNYSIQSVLSGKYLYRDNNDSSSAKGLMLTETTPTSSATTLQFANNSTTAGYFVLNNVGHTTSGYHLASFATSPYDFGFNNGTQQSSETSSVFLYKYVPQITFDNSPNEIGGFYVHEKNKKQIVAFGSKVSGDDFTNITSFGIKVYSNEECSGNPAFIKASTSTADLTSKGGCFYTILGDDETIVENKDYYAKAYVVVTAYEEQTTVESDVMHAVGNYLNEYKI